MCSRSVWQRELSARLGHSFEHFEVGHSAISETHCIALPNRNKLFVKVARSAAPPGLIDAECFSLQSIAATKTVSTPSISASGAGWVALEWIDRIDWSNGGWCDLGRDLAALHGATHPSWGWPHDNYIGAIPQRNAHQDDWGNFWRDHRIDALSDAAQRRDLLSSETMRRIDRLQNRLPDMLAAAADDGPSLLHGDLWIGNVMRSAAEENVVFDPSSYYGHREVDLAMAALFGGFSPQFFSSYQEARPLQPEWEQRRAVYQLYYVLAHLLMFGSGYHPMTIATLSAAGF